jgi:hypothetical protein
MMMKNKATIMLLAAMLLAVMAIGGCDNREFEGTPPLAGPYEDDDPSFTYPWGNSQVVAKDADGWITWTGGGSAIIAYAMPAAYPAYKYIKFHYEVENLDGDNWGGFVSAPSVTLKDNTAGMVGGEEHEKFPKGNYPIFGMDDSEFDAGVARAGGKGIMARPIDGFPSGVVGMQFNNWRGFSGSPLARIEGGENVNSLTFKIKFTKVVLDVGYDEKTDDK